MERGIPLMLSGYGGLQEDGHNYTFAAGSDIPQPYFNILWGTRELSFDVGVFHYLLEPYPTWTYC